MVNFHIAKVLKVIAPGKDVISADSSLHAAVEMWDGNQFVLGVEAAIAASLKQGDIVLIDYNPLQGIHQPIPKQTITKILKGKQGKECWDMFKKYYAEKKAKHESRDEPPTPGISYSR